MIINYVLFAFSEVKVNVQIGKLCQNDKDGDGEPDDTDICPERSDISRMDDFRNIETMDLCKKDKVKSKLFMCQKYVVRFSTIINVDNNEPLL